MKPRDEIRKRLDELARLDLTRSLEAQERLAGARVRVRGREASQFCSNDYLGLARHPEVIKAAREALDACGAGSTGSRLLSGELAPHRGLEALAESLWGRPALLFGAGYLANLAILTSLPTRRIWSDERNHASLVDGCRLSDAEVRIFPHNDPDALEKALTAEDDTEGDLLVVESVFSMDGDRARLRDMVELKNRYGLLLVLDEAHGVGVLGDQGLGLAEEEDLLEEVDVIMAGAGKALGSQGGLAIASSEVKQLLISGGRSFLFSTAPAPAAVAATGAALTLSAGDEGRRRRARLARNASEFRRLLELPDGDGPIVPVPVGDEARAVRMAEALLGRGVFCRAVRFPTVPHGQARLRFTITAEHEMNDLEAAAEAVLECRKTEFP